MHLICGVQRNVPAVWNRLSVSPAACGVLLCAALAGCAVPDGRYPHTRRQPVQETLHGVTISDPYRWLEDGESNAVRAWTDRQNAYTRAALDRFGTERTAIVQQLEQLNDTTTTSSPAVVGNRLFFTRRTGLQNQPVLCYRENTMSGDPKIAVDPNRFSDDGTVALDWWFPSPDGGFLIYGRSAGGSEQSTLYLRDVNAGADTQLRIPHTRACSVAWEARMRGFYYTRYPDPAQVPPEEASYNRHVYYHKFGTQVDADVKVFGEGRAKEEWNDVKNTSDFKHVLLLNSLDWARNDLYIRKSDGDSFEPIAVGMDGRFDADTFGQQLFIQTNWQAPRGRILATELDKLGREHWKEIIPQGDGVLDSFVIVGGKIVAHYLQNAHSKVRVYERSGELYDEIRLPGIGTIRGLSGRADAGTLYFSFESFAYPPAVCTYDVKSREMKIVEQTAVNVDFSQFVTQQLWTRSEDGARVPLFVIHRKDIRLNGDNPTVLFGYGGFEISLTPVYSPQLFVWLNRGGVYAVANLRGGGEFGAEWHQAGRLDRKQNVFNDFYAAAEKLIRDGYTRPERLGCYGGSNGGLLIGAAITQRPDLWRAAHSAVPLLDMIRYHKLSIARLWIPEYGSAEDADQFRALLAYSPYHNVKPGTCYPATLLSTAESDTRVDPMHARKMAALLQSAQGCDDRPILLRVETKAGHGAGKPLRKQIETQADHWTFMCWQLGVFSTVESGAQSR